MTGKYCVSMRELAAMCGMNYNAFLSRHSRGPWPEWVKGKRVFRREIGFTEEQAEEVVDFFPPSCRRWS